MKLGVGIFAFLSALALGYGAGHALLIFTSSDLRKAQPVSIERELAALETVVEPAGQTPWPALFGTYVPPAEPVVELPEPEPEPEPLPPLDYELVGLVSGDTEALSWAIIREAGIEHLVRVGDALPGGETVIGMDEDGVWVNRDGSRAMISFSDGGDNLFSGLLKPAVTDLPVARVPLHTLSGRDLSRVLSGSGDIEMRALDGGDGERYPEITWVQDGQLFDMVGLKRGDMILSVNGFKANDPETLAMAPQMLEDSAEFLVEILRGGQPMTITVRIDGRG